MFSNLHFFFHPNLQFVINLRSLLRSFCCCSNFAESPRYLRNARGGYGRVRIRVCAFFSVSFSKKTFFLQYNSKALANYVLVRERAYRVASNKKKCEVNLIVPCEMTDFENYLGTFFFIGKILNYELENFSYRINIDNLCED